MEETVPQEFKGVCHEAIQNRSRETQTNFRSVEHFEIQGVSAFRRKVKRQDSKSNENVLLPYESFQIPVFNHPA